MDEPDVTKIIDISFKGLMSNNRTTAMLRGLNTATEHIQNAKSKYSTSYTFFTRPVLNLRDSNLIRSPGLHSLLDKRENSIHRYVRNMLDPRLHSPIGTTDTHLGFKGEKSYSCNTYVNESLAFIPILSNSLLKLGSFPEPSMDTRDSPQGLKKEQYSYTDSLYENNSIFELDATFENVTGDVVKYLFYIWLKYISYAKEGLVMPYPDYHVARRIDFMTRVFRINLAEDYMTIKNITVVPAMYPISGDFLKDSNYDSEKPGEWHPEFSVKFKCMGVLSNEYRLLLIFNRTIAFLNDNIREHFFTEGVTHKDDNKLLKLHIDEVSKYNFRTIPFIDINTNRLEHYTDNTELIQIIKERRLKQRT